MAELLHLRNPPKAPLIAEGRAMRDVLERAAFYAKLRAPILLDGPTGTGKSTLARWIHDHSRRAQGPFVPVNCGAIASDLFASEVFGHVRGAFTGATHGKPGLARSALGGTLFLDEIGELTLPDQRKLLTFLDTGAVRPVGSSRSDTVDVRIVVATHRDLTCETTFRQDLRYRLEALRITLPSLVQRPEDRHELNAHLVQYVAQQNDLSPLRVTPEAEAALAARDWPGNVRQLRNVLLNALVRAHMEECPRIEARHVDASPKRRTWKSLCEGHQEALIAEAIRETKTKKDAAAYLDLSPSQFFAIQKRLRSG